MSLLVWFSGDDRVIGRSFEIMVMFYVCKVCIFVVVDSTSFVCLGNLCYVWPNFLDSVSGFIFAFS